MTHGPPIKPHQRVCTCPLGWGPGHSPGCERRNREAFLALVAKTREDFKKEAK